METSILTSTKKILGVDEGQDAFDLDIVTFINTALSVLDQLGVGVSGGFSISGSDETWDQLGLPDNQLNLAKTFVSLKTRMLFDPPNNSFLINAAEKQLSEYEFRLMSFAETEV